MALEAQTDTAVTPNPVTVNNALSPAEAAKRFGAQRQQQGTNNPTNDISAHASAMGKRAAEIRKQRATEATEESQETGENVEDDQTQSGEAQDEVTANAETPEESETEAKDEPDTGTIDLGDGVTMTKDEIRESILLKADHTRRLMEDAEVRKKWDGERAQRQSLLDNAVVAAQSLLGQPKDPESLIEEFGMEEGMRQYFKQVKQFETLGQVIQARQQEQAQHLSGLKQATLKEMAARHGNKAEEAFTKAVQYVSEKTGTDSKAVEAMLSHPEAISLVLDGIKHRELEASKPRVEKIVAGKPPVIKPGAKVSAQASATNRVDKAHATLKKSGSIADGVALLRARRGAGRHG